MQPFQPVTPREHAMMVWIAASIGTHEFSIAPASADASFRRYFRVTFDAGTRIVMDAPPDKENCRPFIHVAELMRAAGLNVPTIYAQDLDQGFLLLTDLGTATFLNVLNADDPAAAAPLFADASSALVQWQLATREGVLPPYDDALLLRELNLFPDWYIARHLQHELSTEERNTLDASFKQIVASNLAQPMVFVHRDFMPRNLMHTAPNPGVLDFQDAVTGPITYDIACLLKDAFISWDEEHVLDWTIRYWEKARKAKLPVRSDFAEFYRESEWMGLQRHLKVAGIFARISYRDGKPHYLTDTPRFINYIRKVAERYNALGPLLKLVDSLEGKAVEVGYTF